MLLAEDAALRAPLREAGYEGERRQTRHQEAPQSAQCLSIAQQGRSHPPAQETAAEAKALKTVEGNQAGCSSSNHRRTQELIERHRGVLKRARAELTSQASELTRLTLQVSELETEREEDRGRRAAMGDQEVAAMGRSLADVQVDPSCHTLSGRLKCMVRRHKCNKDFPPCRRDWQGRSRSWSR